MYGVDGPTNKRPRLAVLGYHDANDGMMDPPGAGKLELGRLGGAEQGEGVHLHAAAKGVNKRKRTVADRMRRPGLAAAASAAADVLRSGSRKGRPLGLLPAAPI
jgi:hypothetical protein